MKKEIKHDWHFNQPPEEVWDYLTKPELIEQWLMKTNFQPVIGHKFYFIGNCDNEHKAITYCVVLEILPYMQLTYFWQTNSAKDHKPFTSKVVWTLTPKADGTLLQLVHDGFRELEDVVLHNDGWTKIGYKMAELLNAVKI